jgi:hypothetical protein
MNLKADLIEEILIAITPRPSDLSQVLSYPCTESISAIWLQ